VSKFDDNQFNAAPRTAIRKAGTFPGWRGTYRRAQKVRAMPKRKIVEQEFPEALAAIREALKNPKILNAEEERDFLERRKGMHIDRHEYIAIERRGKIVYRAHGIAGADLPVPPYYLEMLKRRRDFEAAESKVERQLSARWLYKPRQEKAAELASRIRMLAETITGGSQHKMIAREAGCSVAIVKRALSGRK